MPGLPTSASSQSLSCGDAQTLAFVLKTSWLTEGLLALHVAATVEALGVWLQLWHCQREALRGRGGGIFASAVLQSSSLWCWIFLGADVPSSGCSWCQAFPDAECSWCWCSLVLGVSWCWVFLVLSTRLAFVFYFRSFLPPIFGELFLYFFPKS